MKDGKIVLGITHGDANGIGYEVMIRSFADQHFTDQFIPVIYGSGRVFSYYKKVLGYNNVSFHTVPSAREAHSKRINLIETLPDEFHVEMGVATRAGGDSARRALERFVEDWQQGGVDGLVTLPVNKQSMQGADFHFPGHTEYLAAATGGAEPLMLMVSDRLRVGVVTGHVPLVKVSEQLTHEAVLRCLRVMREALYRDFEITQPCIAVLGLNPHAGEQGMLGYEEEDVIAPAIAAANAEGIVAVGPFSADGFFGAGKWARFDAVLAMYHDQGLAPFKTISFDNGVNVTAGLPLVRTSPAHGTAYDLVGKCEASCTPFREAVYTAIDMARCRVRTDAGRAKALPPREKESNKSGE